MKKPEIYLPNGDIVTRLTAINQICIKRYDQSWWNVFLTESFLKIKNSIQCQLFCVENITGKLVTNVFMVFES